MPWLRNQLSSILWAPLIIKTIPTDFQKPFTSVEKRRKFGEWTNTFFHYLYVSISWESDTIAIRPYEFSHLFDHLLVEHILRWIISKAWRTDTKPRTLTCKLSFFIYHFNEMSHNNYQEIFSWKNCERFSFALISSYGLCVLYSMHCIHT